MRFLRLLLGGHKECRMMSWHHLLHQIYGLPAQCAKVLSNWKVKYHTYNMYLKFHKVV